MGRGELGCVPRASRGCEHTAAPAPAQHLGKVQAAVPPVQSLFLGSDEKGGLSTSAVWGLAAPRWGRWLSPGQGDHSGLFFCFFCLNKFHPGQLFFESPAAFEKPLIWRMAETSHQGSDLPWIPEARSWLPGATHGDTPASPEHLLCARHDAQALTDTLCFHHHSCPGREEF